MQSVSSSKNWQKMTRKPRRTTAINKRLPNLEVEEDRTKAMLEYFVTMLLPYLKEFLTLFQENSPTIHTVYNSICYKSDKNHEKVYKSQFVPCQDVKLQLSDIVQGTRTTEVGETKVCSSWHSIVLSSHSYTDKVALVCKTLLRDLGFSNPTKGGIENNSY